MNFGQMILKLLHRILQFFRTKQVDTIDQKRRLLMKDAVLSIALAVSGIIVLPTSSIAADVVQPFNDRSTTGVTGQASFSAKELYNMVNKPSTPMQMLENMKFAQDHDFLLREDFYTNENFEKYFGAEKVVNEKADIQEKNILVNAIHFGNLFKPVKIAGLPEPVPGAQLTLLLKTNQTGNLEAGVNLSIQIEGPNFEQVQEVFGSKWKLDNTLRLHGPLPPPTGPHGNEVWRYTYDSPIASRHVYFEFHGNGTLAIANFSEEGK
jgi:hypothetical protein